MPDMNLQNFLMASLWLLTSIIIHFSYPSHHTVTSSAQSSSISITTASPAHHPPQWRQRQIQGTRLSTVTTYSIPQWRTGCGWARHRAGKSLATPLETGFWRGMRGTCFEWAIAAAWHVWVFFLTSSCNSKSICLQFLRSVIVERWLYSIQYNTFASSYNFYWTIFRDILNIILEVK